MRYISKVKKYIYKSVLLNVTVYEKVELCYQDHISSSNLGYFQPEVQLTIVIMLILNAATYRCKIIHIYYTAYLTL